MPDKIEDIDFDKIVKIANLNLKRLDYQINHHGVGWGHERFMRLCLGVYGGKCKTSRDYFNIDDDLVEMCTRTLVELGYFTLSQDEVMLRCDEHSSIESFCSADLKDWATNES